MVARAHLVCIMYYVHIYISNNNITDTFGGVSEDLCDWDFTISACYNYQMTL